MSAPGRLAEQCLRAKRMVRGMSAEQWALAGNPIAGTCTVCGSRALFHDFTTNFRESGTCPYCNCFNRQRQMAFVLRRVLKLPANGPLTLPAACRLYSAEAHGPLHSRLATLPGYVCSEYWGSERVPGSQVNGIRHEDLERLSFADATFDVVLSSDVLEHVADAYAAHREILRVLRPGGCHIFTVPFRPWAANDEVRARRVDGSIEYIAEPQYHDDPIRPEPGALVWRIFGIGMLAELSRIGFRTRMLRTRHPRYGILGGNALVFLARKPKTAV